MRRPLLAALVLTLAAGAADAQTAFLAHIGASLFRYDRAYLVTGVAHLSNLAEQMELHLGADFGISTSEESDGDIVPSFLVPVDIGLNFTFARGKTTFYVGTGITPTFLFDRSAEDDFRFYMGPYGRAGVRLKVHAIMSAFLDVQQDLLIGRPDWINTATEIIAGIHFSFP